MYIPHGFPIISIIIIVIIPVMFFVFIVYFKCLPVLAAAAGKHSNK
jgi:hypothetical protein